MLINLPYFLYLGKLAGVSMPAINMLVNWAHGPGVYDDCAVTSLDSLREFYA
jgi:hypothetical protein